MVDLARKRANHARYMKEVWYPKNKAKHIKMVAVTRERRRQEGREFIKTLKLNCKNCGESDQACLDFHHRNPKEKDFNVSRGLEFSRKTILKEIAKCDVLCSNCHRKLHSRGDGAMVAQLAHNQ